MTAVLLIPAAGDSRLLQEGPGDARPPMAEKWPQEAWKLWAPGTMEARLRYPGYQRALILAWGGKLVVEGCDRTWRTFEGSPYSGQSLGILIRSLSEWPASRGRLVYLNAEFEEVGVGGVQ